MEGALTRAKFNTLLKPLDAVATRGLESADFIIVAAEVDVTTWRMTFDDLLVGEQE